MRHIWNLLRIVCLFFLNFNLEDNHFTILWWFLPPINTTQKSVFLNLSSAVGQAVWALASHSPLESSRQDRQGRWWSPAEQLWEPPAPQCGSRCSCCSSGATPGRWCNSTITAREGNRPGFASDSESVSSSHGLSAGSPTSDYNG